MGPERLLRSGEGWRQTVPQALLVGRGIRPQNGAQAATSCGPQKSKPHASWVGDDNVSELERRRHDAIERTAIGVVHALDLSFALVVIAEDRVLEILHVAF